MLGLPRFDLQEFPPVNETVRQFYEEQCLVLGTVKLLLAQSARLISYLYILA